MQPQHYVMNKMILLKNVHFQEAIGIEALSKLEYVLKEKGFVVQTEYNEMKVYESPYYNDEDKQTLIAIGDGDYISQLGFTDKT